jgi:hypothetical protein
MLTYAYMCIRSDESNSIEYDPVSETYRYLGCCVKEVKEDRRRM